MLKQATTPTNALRMPAEIDAHLMFVALDGVSVVLQAGSARIPGRFDLADGFGEISFIDQRASATSGVLSPCEVTVEYYVGSSTLHRFSTRMIARSGQDRVRLVRPRCISRMERRIVPRVHLPASSGHSVTFSEPEGTHPSEVVDLSNTGAQLVVTRSVGLRREGQTAAGWLRLGAQSEPIPVTVEVRHVAPLDEGRVTVGVRFSEIRHVDRVRLTRHVVGLPEAHVA